MFFFVSFEFFSFSGIGNIAIVSQCLILDIIDKVKHYIRIKTDNIIIFRFLVKNYVKYLIFVIFQ